MYLLQSEVPASGNGGPLDRMQEVSIEKLAIRSQHKDDSPANGCHAIHDPQILKGAQRNQAHTSGEDQKNGVYT